MDQEKSCCGVNWREPKIYIVALAVLLLAGVIIVSILRERFVNEAQNQVTVMGRGVVEYQPDTALVTLGVQIDKAPKPEEALSLLNQKADKIITALEGLGISKEEVKTQNYSLYPQYEFKDGSSNVSGYNANEQLVIKVKNIKSDEELVGKVISSSSNAGANQVIGVSFDTSDISNLKQDARIAAIKDAREKAGSLAKAAGIRKLGKVVGWYENLIESPEGLSQSIEGMGAGGNISLSAKSQAVNPNIPSGNQRIVIEIGLNYEVK